MALHGGEVQSLHRCIVAGSFHSADEYVCEGLNFHRREMLSANYSLEAFPCVMVSTSPYNILCNTDLHIKHHFPISTVDLLFFVNLTVTRFENMTAMSFAMSAFKSYVSRVSLSEPLASAES